eukprot:37969-Chlamydomonas_euryale.AAC.1
MHAASAAVTAAAGQSAARAAAPHPQLTRHASHPHAPLAMQRPSARQLGLCRPQAARAAAWSSRNATACVCGCAAAAAGRKPARCGAAMRGARSRCLGGREGASGPGLG